MSSRPLDAGAVALLIFLCMSWGLQQVAVKLALPAFPPMTQMALRSAGACVLVLAWCALTGRGRLLLRDGTLRWGVLAGLFFAAEFVLVYVGLQWTEASRTSLFVYTAPFFVALGAHWLLPQERLAPAQWLGLLFSFAGIALALGVPRTLPSAKALIGDIMMVGAGALWAATTLAIKASPLRTAPAEKVLIYQLAVSVLVGALGAAALGERIAADVAASAAAALAYQTLWVAGVTFLVWFRMLSHYPASPLQAGTSMTPLFGIIGAAVILGEPVSLWFAIAAGLVGIGLVLINRRRPDEGAPRRVIPDAAPRRHPGRGASRDPGSSSVNQPDDPGSRCARPG